MDGVSYAGEPLDVYLQELDIDEETVPAVDERATALSSSSSALSSPALHGLPGAFELTHRSRSPMPAAKAGGAWWAELFLGLLPVELITMLSLSAGAREDQEAARTTAGPPMRADYRFLLVSSSLLEASLPRATERPSVTAPALQADPTTNTKEFTSEETGDSPPSLRGRSPSASQSSTGRRLRTTCLALSLLAAAALILLVAGSLATWPAWITTSMVGLIFGSSLYFLPTSGQQRPLVTTDVLEEPSSRRSTRLASLGGSSSNARPPPAEAVSAIERLVDQAEAFDRSCNSGLALIWDAERDRPAPDVTALLLLRRRLADTFSDLQHHVETAHANVLALTSPSELYALSALYSLGAIPAGPTASLGLPSRGRPNSSPAQVTPLRRARTITAGASSASSPASARRTPLAVERFVSPPPRPSSFRLGDSTPGGDGEESPPPSPAQLTMMPPRTPRLGRHGRTSTGLVGEGPLTALRSWSPLVSSPATQVEAGDIRLQSRSGLLPSPSLSPDPAAIRRKARSPSLDESEEDAAAGSSLRSHDLLRGMPRPSQAAQRTPSGGQEQMLLDLQLQSPSQPLTSRSAKRRSLQDITYRHASSPLAQLTPRRSPVEPSFPATTSPPTTSGLPRLLSLRSDRSSFSHAAGPRPTFGAFSPVPGLQRPRHRPTLSLTSPSVPNLQARAFEQHQAALADLSASAAADTSAGLFDSEPDAPVPLSHADLLTTFWALHARRRHILVALLALRRDMKPEAWTEAANFVSSLATAFEEAKDEVARALLIASQSYGGADGSDSFAPPPLTKAEQRQASLGKLWEGFQLLSGKVGSLEDTVETGDGWESTWLELRDDLGELIRVWERARTDMGIQIDGGPGSLLGLPREMPVRPLDIGSADDNDAAAVEEGLDGSTTDPSTAAQAEIEDDVSRYLRETANTLPSVGREELFAAESAPGLSRRPPSKMTREERIRLAKEHRVETQRAVAEAAAKKGPRGMTDVILELDGLMRVLRRNKGAVEPAEEEEEEQETLLDVDDGDEDGSLGRRPPVAIHPIVLPAPTTQRHLPPFGLPLPPARNRSSLPALSSEGSSDGEADLDDSLEFVSPRHRDGSQLTLRAVESDDEDGLVSLGRGVCEPTKM